ncbi:hypothetical protein BABINDRAFT_167843 [Babjeviella inositovora NRRL Y-12698]|uniref:SPX domain-containing protein n=1 Tax=Babjeviella inositovora NRRL Y-12698 TaxID=984486 RepID=A0A1E3QLS8_9ASCO|nr:uncharacterized protein BABINDRAFT_167843 [Babjeviella inositovora NRRL Y-12698]ODQ78641.1 hypothetical protein BABINDRAFT_167843 [Babjeviella inositovora NRRL Y-12698]
MKFGKKLEQLSVPAWKNYNIDYNDLKRQIRRATDADGTALPLRELRAAFVAQIDFVSLFVSLKRGELERKLVYYQNSLHSLLQIPAAHSTLRKKKMVYLSNEIHQLSGDLKNLTHFVLIQKVALKKLFKKFLKHYKGGKNSVATPQDLVPEEGLPQESTLKGIGKPVDARDPLESVPDDQDSPVPYTDKASTRSAQKLVNSVILYLNTHPQSFITLDLTPLILELAFFFEYLSNPDSTTQNIDTFLSSQKANNNMTFDLDCTVKHHSQAVFVVDGDNLPELRLNLMVSGKQFRLVSDELQSFKSESLRHLTKKDPKTHSSTSLASSYARAHTDSVLSYIYLTNDKNTNALVISSQGKLTSLVISPVGGLRGYAYCELSNELLNATILSPKASAEFVVQSLQKAGCYNGLAKMSVDWILEKGLRPHYKTRMARARFVYAPDARAQTMNVTLDTQILVSALNLTVEWGDDDAEMFRYSMLTVHHNESDTRDSSLGPLRDPARASAVGQFHRALHVVVHELPKFSWPLYLAAKFAPLPGRAALAVDSVSFKQVNEDAVVVVEPPLRRQPLFRPPVSPLDSPVGSPGPAAIPAPGRSGSMFDMALMGHSEPIGYQLSQATTNSRPKKQPETKVRYWNEFDDGSEDEDDGFYVDEESNLFGVGEASPSKFNRMINFLIEFSDTVSGRLEVLGIKRELPQATSPAVSPGEAIPRGKHSVATVATADTHRTTLSSLISSRSVSETSTSEDEGYFVPLINHDSKFRTRDFEGDFAAGLASAPTSPGGYYGAFDDREAVSPDYPRYYYQQRHDQVVTVIYFLCFFFSILVMGVSSGVIYSIDRSLGDTPGSGNVLLMAVTCFSLVLSFVSGIVGGTLIMMRFHMAPLWHHAVVWSGIATNFGFLVWGIVQVVK